MVEGLSTLSDWIDTPIYSWVSEFSVWTKARDVINGKLCDNDYCDCKHVPAPDEMSLPERLAIYLNISIDSTCCQHAGFVTTVPLHPICPPRSPIPFHSTHGSYLDCHACSLQLLWCAVLQ